MSTGFLTQVSAACLVNWTEIIMLYASELLTSIIWTICFYRWCNSGFLVCECTLPGHVELLSYQHPLLRSKSLRTWSLSFRDVLLRDLLLRTPSPSPQGRSHSTQNNLCLAFICSWDCPAAGPGTWCYWNSWGWHRPTWQVEQDACGCHPSPPACGVHHTARLCQPTCWGRPSSHWPYCWQRSSTAPVPNPTPWEFHLSLISTWTLTHWPQFFECNHPANSIRAELSTCQIHVYPV